MSADLDSKWTVLSSKSGHDPRLPPLTVASGPVTGTRSDGPSDPDSWASVPHRFRASTDPLPPPWSDYFEPLRAGSVDDLMVVGQIGQSLDGRIATEKGRSHYINGIAGRAHLHRLRALVDAVIVGVGTAIADDPRLTVRLVAGPHPARVVVDPSGRLPRNARLLAEDSVRRLVLTTGAGGRTWPADVEVLSLPAVDGRIAPAAILASLAEQGLRRLLVEGGADTISGFLTAGCLDRLHIVVAPIILGAGRTGLAMPPVEHPHEAPRVKMRVYPLDDEVLLDCDLSARRLPIGVAKKSM